MSARSLRAAAPFAALGVLGAAIAAWLDLHRTVWVEGALWSTALAIGLAGAAVAAGVVEVRARVARARDEGEAAGRTAAAAEHRRFLLRLDHELKNPVTAIQLGLANAAATADPAPALASVSTQARRLADLVADLRKLAELETRPIERAPVDLVGLLHEVFDEAGDLPGADQRVLDLALPRAPWPLGKIPGDRDLLFLAVYNLLVNAVKFTRPGDRIELRARDEDDRVLVEVADTGIGIPADEVDQIWGELARGSAAAGTPGSGLGLALARIVVTRHDGAVEARSRVGEGTVVGFRLPSR